MAASNVASGTLPRDLPQPPPGESSASAECDELNCPLCGYDLRGLPANRCPECGHQFDPDELRREKREYRGWFFEPSHRPLVAFVTTTLASLRPWRFWKNVAAAYAIVPARLKAWAIAWVAIFFVGAAAAFVGSVTYEWNNINTIGVGSPLRGPSVPRGMGILAPGVDWTVVAGSLWDERQLRRASLALAVILAWPAVAMLTMQLFGFTLRRAGIRPGHLARCVLYPLPLMLFPLLIFTAGSCAFGWNAADPWGLPIVVRSLVYEPVPDMVWRVAAIIGLNFASAMIVVVAMVITTTHLVAAHVRYLRLPHAVAHALLVQIVTWLAFLAVLFLSGD